MPRSLTRTEIEALPDGTGIVVTLAGRFETRQTVVGELRKMRTSPMKDPFPTLFAGGLLVAFLTPGDGLDEDFVAIYEGADPAPQPKEPE